MTPTAFATKNLMITMTMPLEKSKTMLYAKCEKYTAFNIQMWCGVVVVWWFIIDMILQHEPICQDANFMTHTVGDFWLRFSLSDRFVCVHNSLVSKFHSLNILVFSCQTFGLIDALKHSGNINCTWYMFTRNDRIDICIGFDINQMKWQQQLASNCDWMLFPRNSIRFQQMRNWHLNNSSYQ